MVKTEFYSDCEEKPLESLKDMTYILKRSLGLFSRGFCGGHGGAV